MTEGGDTRRCSLPTWINGTGVMPSPLTPVAVPLRSDQLRNHYIPAPV